MHGITDASKVPAPYAGAVSRLGRGTPTAAVRISASRSRPGRSMTIRPCSEPTPSSCEHLRSFDHVNIVVEDLEATQAFFVDNVGFVAGTATTLEGEGRRAERLFEREGDVCAADSCRGRGSDQDRDSRLRVSCFSAGLRPAVGAESASPSTFRPLQRDDGVLHRPGRVVC